MKTKLLTFLVLAFLSTLNSQLSMPKARASPIKAA